MNKLVLFVFGVLLGAVIMYIIGDFFPRIIIQHTTIKNERNSSVDTADNQVKKPVKKNGSIVETIEYKQLLSDTNLETENLDTLFPVQSEPPSATESDYQVIRDKQIGKRTVIIQQYHEIRDTSATAKIADKVGEEISFSRNLNVEFWESPIDFMGYKLNKTTLIFYGISPQESFELIYNDSESLLLIIDRKKILLKKTEKYKSITL